jgi:hypothetical protein
MYIFMYNKPFMAFQLHKNQDSYDTKHPNVVAEWLTRLLIRVGRLWISARRPLFWISFSEVFLSPSSRMPGFLLLYGLRLRLRTDATNGHIGNSPDDIRVQRTAVEWYWQEKTEELGVKPVPEPLCPPQIPHGLTRAQTRDYAGRGRRLTV